MKEEEKAQQLTLKENVSETTTVVADSGNKNIY